MRPFFLPRSWHWSSKWRTCLGTDCRSLRQQLSSPTIASHVNLLERHLNDTWKLHSTVILIFFSIKIQGGKLWDRRGCKKKKKMREKNTRVSILTHRINSFHESSVIASDWHPKYTSGKSSIPLASRAIQCWKESTVSPSFIQRNSPINNVIST